MTPAERVLKRLAKNPKKTVFVPQLEGPLRAHLAAELLSQGKKPVIIGRNQEDAETIYRDLAFILGTSDESAADQGLLFLGADEKSPYEEYSPDGRAVMERINTLYRLAKEPKSVRCLVVTPHALVRKHVPPQFFSRSSEYLIVEEEIDRDHLLERLTCLGYNSVSTVEDPGTFSVRGGIIDIYSPYHLKPLRLDLFGDEIESIYLFEPTSQRNIRKIDDAMILPAREIVFEKEIISGLGPKIDVIAEDFFVPTRKLNAVLDDINNQIHFFGIEGLLPLFHPNGLCGLESYLPQNEDTVFICHDVDSIGAYSDEIWAEIKMGFEQAQAGHKLALPIEQHLIDADEVWEKTSKNQAQVRLPEVAVDIKDPVEVSFETTESLRNEILRATRSKAQSQDVLAPVIERLKKWRLQGHSNFIVCHTRGQAERLKQMLADKGVQIRLYDKPFSLSDFQNALTPHQAFRERTSTLKDNSVHAWLILGEISSGYCLPSAHMSFLSEEEIFGARMKRRRKRKPPAGEFVSDLQDLKEGDYVVHVDYGVGLYKGMTKLAVNGVDSDYLYIEYKGQDKLYLPVHRLKLIQKYVSATEGRNPVLDKLGSQAWTNTKKKVRDNLLKMAAELLRIHAVRTSMEGYAFPPPDHMFRQFEAEFQFEPTKDQAQAIQDVVADVQKPSPMDRLICGDVGYGKTEVAMRATMMSVVAGKQTAVLVPTTVLAAQHYNVFQERFKNFGVNIGIISRFQTKEEIKRNLAFLKEGKLDIVIGTHRLLGKDVQFKDLGLLVIDEEHRFGVSHKEKLKKYRATVHIIAMSATPIPRTLHMGFMGVRDMSMIATPPEDRLAVKTEVHRFAEETIRDAILKELRRGGQCFVVHNRVASIGAFAKFIEKLVPEARVAVGHGQMDQERLEKVMVDFMNKEYNVLLSTTIIESGIDIPNANTIIINRSDMFGLAQLYQLRGRVGRGKARGFAHFLIPSGNLSKKARKRIAVLQRFTELGAGFKVASKDMEIRGAGNLLGKQQHGTISKVGFDMYQILLKEAIEELQGSARKSLREPEIQVPVPSFIPDKYIPTPGERLAYYQRFNNAETDEATYDLLQEIGDLYGSPPPEVENLAQMMLVKQRLFRIGSIGMDYGPSTKTMPPRIVVRFDDQAQLSPQQLVDYVQAGPKSRKLTPEGKLLIHLKPIEDYQEILLQAKEHLEDLGSIKYRAMK